MLHVLFLFWCACRLAAEQTQLLFLAKFAGDTGQQVRGDPCITCKGRCVLACLCESTCFYCFMSHACTPFSERVLSPQRDQCPPFLVLSVRLPQRCGVRRCVLCWPVCRCYRLGSLTSTRCKPRCWTQLRGNALQPPLVVTALLLAQLNPL